ncbi:anti-sigma regulatory factor (Ser/Thr protein kinase) [Desulfocapsa sulfexigens DSM 10523]|uniref:Anti-sigma regulatory factor (Ser/Thr protein kinase) n=1 Tax=Desulfocapsa sulfexigens (strain DSM 10523 / SB164P1) TaxID=1167006 RepID=M1P2J9_DESSD|nr:ATP-binding protein [Desulfocapsa sulfexigens]AGF77713.1 anti-sigma regulatory factor (Ser/Thr protein kinase) [Desulfocapsa sulfexigens DSM 10523]
MSSVTNEIPSGSSIVFRVPARLADVRLLGFSVHALFQNLGFNNIETYQLELAVTESANNIVKHAYKFAEDTYFNMKFTTTDDRVICTFVDHGIFENFLKNNGQGEIAINTKILPPDSRGIAIICEVMDEVSYRRSGDKNILRLVKYFSRF